MKCKLIIKTAKLRAVSKDKNTRIIVVGYNRTKVNGLWIEKLGTVSVYENTLVINLHLDRIGLWANKGAKINSRVSYYIGMLAKSYAIGNR